MIFHFFNFQLLENNDWEEIQTLELPDSSNEIVNLLLEVVYNGVVEATIEDLRELILLSHRLYISIPLSGKTLLKNCNIKNSVIDKHLFA
jgi:hypothetical protein